MDGILRMPLGCALLGLFHVGSVGAVLLGTAVAVAPRGDLTLVPFALTVYLGLLPFVQLGYALALVSGLVLARENAMAIGVAVGSGITLGLGGVVVGYATWEFLHNLHP